MSVFPQACLHLPPHMGGRDAKRQLILIQQTNLYFNEMVRYRDVNSVESDCIHDSTLNQSHTHRSEPAC